MVQLLTILTGTEARSLQYIEVESFLEEEVEELWSPEDRRTRADLIEVYKIIHG